MNKKVVIIGAGGHAKVIADIILNSGDEIIGFLDDKIDIGKEILNFKVIGKVSDIDSIKETYNRPYFIIGIGSNATRKEISYKYNAKWYTAIHPTSVIGRNVEIGNGTVIMAKAVINPCSKIGNHCIINTSSIVEHDNIIGDYVHICPGVILAGTVHIMDLTQIGVGAIIKNDITIAENSLIGAGAVVVKNIEKSNGIYVGVPASFMKGNNQ